MARRRSAVVILRFDSAAGSARRILTANWSSLRGAWAPVRRGGRGQDRRGEQTSRSCYFFRSLKRPDLVFRIAAQRVPPHEFRRQRVIVVQLAQARQWQRLDLAYVSHAEPSHGLHEVVDLPLLELHLPRAALRGSGRPGSFLTLAPHRSGRAGSAASGSSTDGFATRRRVPAGPGSQAMATAIPKAYLASSAIRCRDVETGPNLGVLAVFPSSGATCRCPLPSTGSRGLNSPASAVL